MRVPRCRPLLVLAALLGAGALAGCSTFTARPDPSRFFFLTPHAARDLPAATAATAAPAPGAPATAAAASPDALPSAAPGALPPASPGAVPSAASGALPSAAPGAVPSATSGALPPGSSGAPPTAVPPAAPQSVPPLAIGLAEVVLPAYLERPELTTRIAANELRFSTTARWAEPLGPGMTRVLAADLVARLGPQSVLRLPWYGKTPLDGELEIEIEHFEADRSAGAARLVARWTLRDAHGQRVLRGGTAMLERPLAVADGVTGARARADGANDGRAPAGAAQDGRALADSGGYAAAVAALSQVLDDFSRDLALAVRQTVTAGNR